MASTLAEEGPKMVQRVVVTESEISKLLDKLKTIKQIEQPNVTKIIVKGYQGSSTEINGEYAQNGEHRKHPLYVNLKTGWLLYYSCEDKWVFDWRGLVNGFALDDGGWELEADTNY